MIAPSLTRVVGREAEIEAIERLLQPGEARARALLMEGEAGIGKTTLWLAGSEEARRRGYRVLACRPAEAEASLPFVALGDLLEPIIEEALPALPAILQSALAVALQRESAADPANRLAISRAALAILRAEAIRGPTLVAVDDVQWLDRASADVIAFAIRRLAETPVRLLVARRGELDDPAPLGLGTVLDARQLERVRIGPLSVEELDDVVRATLGVRLSRPRLVELAGHAAGNPFYALEIARASYGAEPGGLRVPESLTALLRERLAQLAPDAGTAVLQAAAAGQPTVELLRRAGGGVDGLNGAIAAGILAATGERIRFTHPMLASAAIAGAPPWEVRAAHRTLAGLAADPEERARHLAAATEAPDAAVAAQLDAAAGMAAARGAPDAAAFLNEAAARLTPPDDVDGRRTRRSEAAEHHIAAGDPARGREILAELAAELPPGPEHATFLIRLADAGGIDLETSIKMGEQALAEAGDDKRLLAEIETTMGIFTWIVGDLPRSLDHIRRSAEHAAAAGNDVALAIALGEASHAAAVVGRPDPETGLAPALALEERIEAWPPYLRPSFQLGIIRLYRDDPDAARPLLVEEFQRIDAAGDEAARCGVLFRLAELEFRVGNWTVAARHAAESMAIGTQAGITQEQSVGLTIHAQVQAHIGALDEAERRARQALEMSAETRDRIVAMRTMGVLGFIELSRGHPEAALEWLTPASAELGRLGVGELSIHQVVNNELEALVAVDRLDDAAALADRIDAAGQAAGGRVWHAAVAARGRALVASARGDVDAARAEVIRALEAHQRLPQPFERARTLLAQGAIERRHRSWAPARAALTQALEAFDQLGAARWAERAAAELQRLPGRPPASGAGRQTLTETERQIADLVAEGLTNKEIAGRMFVAVRTVEANLTRIYEKLDVRSRTELARLRLD